MHPWHDIAVDEHVEAFVPAFIEIPKGSKVKYELDKETGLLRVDRILFSAGHYPANYGFIPRSFCGDGDPLDILVLCQEPVEPMCIMRARPLGYLEMRDDKVIAVHVDDPEYAHYREAAELPPHRLKEIQRFFLDYKVLENKTVDVEQIRGRAAAEQVIRDAVRLYNDRIAPGVRRARSGRV